MIMLITYHLFRICPRLVYQRFRPQLSPPRLLSLFQIYLSPETLRLLHLHQLVLPKKQRRRTMWISRICQISTLWQTRCRCTVPRLGESTILYNDLPFFPVLPAITMVDLYNIAPTVDTLSPEQPDINDQILMTFGNNLVNAQVLSLRPLGSGKNTLLRFG